MSAIRIIAPAAQPYRLFRSLQQTKQNISLPIHSSSSFDGQFLRIDGRVSKIRVGSTPRQPNAPTLDDDDDDDSPVSVKLQPIVSHEQFDQIITQSPQPLVILWMATWCRKCIYLKPKLEKLAAEYFSRIRFYSVDVNAVPHKLVSHANVTKMPTIQVWSDSKKQGEVIGGHKAHLVLSEVREMIENILCP